MRKAAAIWTATRTTVVLFSLMAWFGLSNHCALGRIAPPADSASEESGCPMHSAPEKKEPVSKTPCCKDVRAVVAKSVTNAMPFSLRLAAPCEYAAEIFGLPPRLTLEIDGLDTGPPGCLSFAELVLQESTLAHAPPVS